MGNTILQTLPICPSNPSSLLLLRPLMILHPLSKRKQRLPLSLPRPLLFPLLLQPPQSPEHPPRRLLVSNSILHEWRSLPRPTRLLPRMSHRRLLHPLPLSPKRLFIMYFLTRFSDHSSLLNLNPSHVCVLLSCFMGSQEV